MRKCLLFAVAALIAFSANAQQRVAQGKQKSLPAATQRHYAAVPAKNVGKPELISKHAVSNRITTTESLNKALSPVVKFQNTSLAPAKAAEVQAVYDGYGSHVSDGPMSWEMRSGVAEYDDGTSATVLVDVIPDPFGFEDGVMVEYTLEGGIISIAPQLIASNEEGTLFIFLESATSQDGTITLTLDDEGRITGAYSILYGAYSTEEYSMDNYLGYYGNYLEGIKYSLPGETVTPTMSFEPTNLVLFAGLGLNGYSYNSNLAITSAYAPLSFRNTTTDPSTAWEWSIGQELGEDSVGLTGNEWNFSVNAIGEAVYSNPQLIGHNKEAVSDPFNWATGKTLDEETGAPRYEDLYIYSGGAESQFILNNETPAIMTRQDPDGDLTFYTNWATPDKAQNSMSKIYLYHEKPSTPLFITGVTLPLVAFEYEKTFNLKVVIYKATRATPSSKPVLGDILAISDATPANINKDFTIGLTAVEFTDLYVEDELGMSETIDYLFLDTDFVICIEGWDNGTFSGVLGSQDVPNPNAPSSTYFEMSGEEGSMYSYTSWKPTLFVGLLGATYGYLYTEDDTNVKLPIEGGEATLHVQPMYYSDSEEEGIQTRLFLESVSVDGELVDEVPEWLEIGYTNPESNEDISFDLQFAAQALPEGVESRQAEIVLWQEGAKLKVIVTQGNVLADVADLASFKALGDGVEGKLTLKDAVVTFAKGKDVYVQDATGALEFYNTGLPFETGQLVNGTVIGKLSIYNDLPEFVKTDNTNADNLTFAEGTVVVKDMTVADALKEESISKLVKISNVEIAEDGGKYYVVDGDAKLQIYDKFKVIPADFTYPEKANITGIICIFKGTMQIMPISEESIEKIANLPAADFADGKYFLANVATAKYWGAGNSWGTQASLVEHPEYVTLLKQPDGTYQMETQVSNGGTNYFFGGEYMDGQPVALTITTVCVIGESVADGKPVYAYTIANGENYYGYDGESTVLGRDLTADNINALWIIASYDEALAGLATATAEDPMDATFLVLDPNFGRNNRNQSAWTGDGFSVGGDNSNFNAEKWGGNSQTFDVSQTVDAPNGLYKISWNGFYRYNNTTENTNDIAVAAHADGTEKINSFIYINGNDYPLTSIADEAASAALEGKLPFSQGEASAAFGQNLYAQTATVIVNDGKLTIGIKKTEHPGCDWTVWDNFTLQYFGATSNNPDDPAPVAPEGWTSVISNGNLAGNSVSNFVAKEYPSTNPVDATIVDGAGFNNSRGIVVKSQDKVSQAWDSQFWIKVNEKLPEGTKLHVEFDYKADKAASGISTQSHGEPSAYQHYAAIGNVDFATEWKHFSADVNVEGAMADMLSIAFNLNDFAEGNSYYFDNFGVWIQKPAPVNDWVDLLVNGDMEGTTVANFFSKEAPSNEVVPSVIYDGIGVDGGRGIKVESAANAANDWDTQFWIYLPCVLPEGTKYKVEFDYKADRDASADTQAHGEPGNYIFYSMIGSPSFTTEWQHYEKSGSISADQAEAKTDGVPNGNKFRSIAFNLSKDKENAVTFFFDNVKFFVEKDFYETGITNLQSENRSSESIYNLRGQRVSTPAKGQIYIINGKKVVLK